MCVVLQRVDQWSQDKYTWGYCSFCGFLLLCELSIVINCASCLSACDLRSPRALRPSSKGQSGQKNNVLVAEEADTGTQGAGEWQKRLLGKA